MKFEPREQSQEDGERELEDLRHGGDAVLAESHAQVLLDGGDEHDVTAEHGASRLQDGQEQVQRENLWPQLMWPVQDNKTRNDQRFLMILDVFVFI